MRVTANPSPRKLIIDVQQCGEDTWGGRGGRGAAVGIRYRSVVILTGTKPNKSGIPCKLGHARPHRRKFTSINIRHFLASRRLICSPFVAFRQTAKSRHVIVLFLCSSRKEHVELTVPLVSPQSLESTRRMLQLVEEVRKPVTDVHVQRSSREEFYNHDSK